MPRHRTLGGGDAVMIGRWLPRVFLVWGIMILPFLYGYVAGRYHKFPSAQMGQAWMQIKALKASLQGRPGSAFVSTSQPRTVVLHRPAEVSPGMTLVAGVGTKRRLYAALVDTEGRVLRRWDLDWFTLWPNPTHVPKDQKPKERPGGDIHGIALSPNGDLTFNYDELGMAQVDVCGRVKWRLPLLTHHAIYPDEAGNIWSLDFLTHDKADPRLPNYAPPFHEDAVLEVSPSGQVLRRIPIFDLLLRNHLQGLLYMSSTDNASTAVWGESLHVNDVEVFPRAMKPDVFRPGDIMISLRNINTVLVFDPQSLKVKQLIMGVSIRQHDPDFVDGSTISILDNNNVDADQAHGSSRIVEYSVKTGRARVLFQGNRAAPFYTQVMGKQQRLANGNLLLTEESQGRALEVNSHGDMVWEYFNHADKGLLGVLDEAQRISPQMMTPASLQKLVSACPAGSR